MLYRFVALFTVLVVVALITPRSDGRRVIDFKNGTQKEIFPDGHSIVKFANGDIKEV